jgi:hypothetical protein
MSMMTTRNFLVVLVALLILSFSGLALAQGAGADPCKSLCYKEKSAAYQRCRTIPPGERAKRVACFKKADDALKQCLAQCK